MHSSRIRRTSGGIEFIQDEDARTNLFRIMLITESVVDRVAFQILLKSLNLDKLLTIKMNTQEAIEHIVQSPSLCGV